MITFSELGKWGRLGNSLFECAATINLALENNDSYGFPNWEYSKYFNLNYCYFNNIKYDNIYNETGFTYAKIPYKPNTDLRGFFQSEKYFYPVKEMILDLFSINLKINREEGLCGIHIRRGDYLELKDCYNQLDMNYYIDAMKKVNAKKYLIFSDDIRWCKQNFKGKNFEFAENNPDYKDLALMSKKCEHMIIANSSFSWWGAYLNSNPNKIVVAPSKWFGSGLPHDTRDLIPDNWIKL